jgi:hypothetical protein
LNLIRLACLYDPRTFSEATKPEISLFRKCLGSTVFCNDVIAHGSRVDVGAYVREWQIRNAVYQQQSRRYWMYH